MAIDEEVVKAIYKAVEEKGQPEKVGKRLVAWLNALSDRSLTKEDDSRHLDMVKNAIEIAIED